ncbi:MAG: porin family protein [Xanthobacteraceae bacterium]|nr:porin family protein [Xanthobacteraceae bacterium]
MGGMRRYLLATVSAVALSNGAMAADIPARMPVKAPAPVVVAPSWAGFYIGVHAGVAWNHAAFAEVGDNAGNTERAPRGVEFWKPHRAGFAGGGQIGYNFQSGSVVYGLEADFSGVSNKYSTTVVTPGFNSTVNVSTQLNWMATVRGRLGVTLSPTLLYVTGGLAVAHFKDSWGSIFAPVPEYVSNKTRTGWTVGGGVEHMFARNWTAKIEALYADFGDWTIPHAQGAGLSGPYRSRFEHQVVTVRGGLNYKW